MQTIEATVDAEDEWIAHVNDVAKGTMFTAQSCNSWYLGANIPGKPRIFAYVGGVGVYREKCDEVAAKNYEVFAAGLSESLAVTKIGQLKLAPMPGSRFPVRPGNNLTDVMKR